MGENRISMVCIKVGKPMFDYLHRVLTGQTVSPTELRVAGIVVLLWILMDAVEWSDWLFRWR
jgi:hypothetical protein